MAKTDDELTEVIEHLRDLWDDGASSRKKDALHPYHAAVLSEYRDQRKRDAAPGEGIAPCSVELCEAVVAVNDVKRPSQFGQERDCWSPFRSERQARPAGQEVACRL